MTLFNKQNRTHKKARTMMAEEESDSSVNSGASVETQSSSTTVVNMDVPDEGEWSFQGPGARVHSGDQADFDEEGEGRSRTDDRLPGYFVPPATPPSNLGNIPNLGAQGQAAQGATPLETVKGFLESSLPFIILLVVKISFDHRTGIMLFLAMYGTFVHCNEKAVKLMLPGKLRGLSQRGFYQSTLAILLVIGISIFLLYHTFADQRLYRSLYLMIPDIHPVDVWGMLWIVGATDFVVKFATVALKLVLALVPQRVVCSRKRGQLYQVMEVASQLYRSVVPITPWVYFLLDRTGGRGYWLSLFLMTAYVVCKSLDLYKKSKELWGCLLILNRGLVVGKVPGKAHLDSIGSCCVICHDVFNEPVMLSCTHVFCEECILAWFDRERTCPMCRSKVQQAPRWRDGKTSSSIQFF